MTTSIQPLLELKQKINGLGRKKQVALPCTLDLTRSWREILTRIRAGVNSEWRMMLQTVDQPTLLNAYQREYYVTPDNAVRVTLDFDMIAYDQRLSVRPNSSARLPMADNVVIEIKTAQAQLARLEEIAADFPVLRSRNSKYATGLIVALG